MSKADRRLSGARRAQVAQAALMQGILVVAILVFAWFDRADRRASLMALALAIIPAAWGLLLYDAQKRDQAARAAGTWTKESDDRLKKRTYSLLGLAALISFALIAMVYVLA